MGRVTRQQCVWSLIKESVADSELPEIRSILGDALIDMYTEIYSELQTWEQMWHEVHDGSSQMPHSSLADPPAVKELVRSELQLLLLSLRQQAASLARDGTEVMSRYSPRVVTYALGSDSTECATPSSRPESDSIEDEIEELRCKLNVNHINEVVTQLRSLLITESEVLKHDVQLLQESVELEYLRRRSYTEPTLSELKSERRLIQKDLDMLSLMNKSTCTDKPMSEVSQNSSRELRPTGLANDSEMKQAVSLGADFLQPKPPPAVTQHDNKSARLGKTRLRVSVKATQRPIKSPNPAQLQEVDVENVQSSPVQQTSSANAKSSPSKSNISFIGSATFRFKDEMLSGNFSAASTPLIPTPPVGQRAINMGQRMGRRLEVRQQTCSVPPEHISSIF